MKALVCHEPGRLSVETRSEPLRENGLVKVRVRSVGVCGTDFHIFQGDHPFLEYPRVMGHELAGEVAELPAGSKLSVGDPVIFNPYLSCDDCVACRSGKPNCCANISVLGVHADGGMCEYVLVPEEALYAADGLTSDQAAMVEFLSIGAHAVRRGCVESEDRVLVVGTGPIGIGVALFAQLRGADVTLLDLNETRLKAASKILGGAPYQVAGPDSISEAVAATNGDMFHKVFDATGNAKAMEQSLQFVSHGGSLIYVSVVTSDICFPDPFFHAREMSIIGSRNATREDFEHVIKSIQDGAIPTDALNTHSCLLEEAASALPEWLNNPDTVIKAIIRV